MPLLNHGSNHGSVGGSTWVPKSLMLGLAFPGQRVESDKLVAGNLWNLSGNYTKLA